MRRVQIGRWMIHPQLWKFVCFASTVIGLVCYALSSSFSLLFGKWNLLKIFSYTVFSSIICLAVLFAKVWQHFPSASLLCKAHLSVVVLTATTVYSFFYDKAVNRKPDAYSLISCAAFAIMSLGLSRQTHFGFEVDLLYFFLGCLILQLMKIELLLALVGAGFSYSLVILRSCLQQIEAYYCLPEYGNIGTHLSSSTPNSSQFSESPSTSNIPAPSPIPRGLIPVVDGMGHLDVDGHMTSSGTFTVLSYNILSEAYASNDLHDYCPSWALSWPYRRQNLLREIVGYGADIICLQEVQSNHYDEFFVPELDKHGYSGLYKRKTNEVCSGNVNTIDGCATFFRRDRFSHVKKYEVEFNKAAQSLIEATMPTTQKETALNRLVKDNVALIVVLEAKVNNQPLDNPEKRQLLCVANTHVNVPQDLKDVKLWQVHTLLKGLERIAASVDIPMLVCGDFDSVPGSAPHALLAMGKVDLSHPDLTVDPLNILRPHSKLVHQLPLVSAYSSFARTVGLEYEQHKRRLDGGTNEPLFTNVTRDFIGTPDYIFYTADSLVVESLLELLNEENVRKDTALPSPQWSSDHIALLAEFRCCKKNLGVDT